jgi:hypothetical protein
MAARRRCAEPVPQLCVARAMPADVADDQVRRRQEEFVPEALRRAYAYVEAGVDCVPRSSCKEMNP